MEDRWHGAPGGPFRDAGSSSTDGYALGAGRSLSAAASSVNGSHSAADGHIECAFGCSPVEMCYALGIVIHVVGSIGINIGQNLQASGLQTLDEAKRHRARGFRARQSCLRSALFAAKVPHELHT